MNSSGLELNIKPANGFATGETGIANKSTTSTAPTDDNTLKNKEFSNVFNKQQDKRESDSSGLANDDVASIDNTRGDSVSLEDTMQGNGLPVHGTVLPSTAHTSAIVLEQNLDNIGLGALKQLLEGNISSSVEGYNIKPTGRTATALSSDSLELSSSTFGANQSRNMNNVLTQSIGDPEGIKNQTPETLNIPYNQFTAGTALTRTTNVPTGGNGPVSLGSLVSKFNQPTYTQSPYMAGDINTISAANMPVSDSNQGFQLNHKMLADSTVNLSSAMYIEGAEGRVQEGSISSPPLHTGTSQTYRQSALGVFQTAVPIEVGKPGWSNGVMDKVMWMSSQQINSAEISLDPPELGPLQVKISTVQDQTSIIFSSNHSTVRDALDQGISRLRDMMEGQGLNLADVDVSDQGANKRENTDTQDSEKENSSLINTDIEAPVLSDNLTSHQMSYLTGLVDQYI